MFVQKIARYKITSQAGRDTRLKTSVLSKIRAHGRLIRAVIPAWTADTVTGFSCFKDSSPKTRAPAMDMAVIRAVTSPFPKTKLVPSKQRKYNPITTKICMGTCINLYLTLYIKKARIGAKITGRLIKNPTFVDEVQFNARLQVI